jgi:ketosteroid isomerase-like protein
MSASDVMQAYVSAARRGDFDAAFGRFAEDIVFRIPGRGRFAGEHRGREAAMAYINHARSLSVEQEVTVDVVDALVSADRFALVVHERFHRDGEVIELRRCNVYRVEGEQIVEVAIYEGDPEATEALLG